MNRTMRNLLAACAIAAMALIAAPAVGQNKLTVNADQGKDVISKHIYGHFSEHLGHCIYGGYWVGEDSPIPNTRGIRNDVVKALRDISIPNLRWPGGCFADEYHWRDGIGPRSQRPKMVNTHWGGVTEDNSFGTHEFLDLCENKTYHENELEQALIDNLQKFLLELGKGFSFVERQKRISTEGGERYYIDLVFYNYILKCFVVIDLKAGKLAYQDIGQIDFYVRLFDEKIKSSDDNPTIGIVLCADKDESIVKYSVLADKENLFASKYRLYLPTEEQLQAQIQNERQAIERKLKESDFKKQKR